MSETLTRENAFLSMTSPLGTDVLVPARLHLEEELNRPFIAVLDVVSRRDQIDPDTLLFQPVCISLRRVGAPVRHVHGRVRSVLALGRSTYDLHAYRLEVVPTLWFLTQAGDCRIFENKTAKQILGVLCEENGVDADFSRVNGRVRPFTVQFNETNLDFFTRLVEEEGWLFHFRHGPSGHKLLVSDGTAFLDDVPGRELALSPDEGPDCLAEWRVGLATAAGRVAMADYDPEQPNNEPHGETDTKFSTAGASVRDVFRWPAREANSDQICARTRRLIEAAEAEASLASGVAFNENFVPGGRIRVQGPGSGAFVLVRVVHDAADETWSNAPEPPSYRNTFTACPAGNVWRGQPTSRRPRMDGIYSALVIGPDGEEIHTDELGRIKVMFRWDHRRQATAGGAVWVRVMRPWGGPHYGWIAIPRVGTEVGVAFIDGDPERPVVVGQLANNTDLPPLDLPGQRTRSGLSTRSTPRGDADDCSELWFEDRKGEELVLLHAQKDLQVETENDATTTIGNARKTTIQKGDDSLTVEKGNRSVDVPSGNHTMTSNTGNISLATKAGDISVKTTAGAVTLEAMTSLTLKVGQSSVTLDPSGVTIKGPMVQVEGQALASLKGAITKLDADGLMKATAGIMMLN